MGNVVGDKDYPRRGSMQYWPRKRAKRVYPRIKNWPSVDENIPKGFAGYKIGMTHIMAIDNIKYSPTKGQEIQIPVTIIECPPLSVFSLRFYKKTPYGQKIIAQINADSYNENLKRKIVLGKKSKKSKINKKDVLEKKESISKINLIVHTHPSKTCLNKKKPEVFEINIGGEKEEAINKAFELLGKDININDVFSEGEQIDVFGVTKGKGFQGSVKRFGVKIGSHKAEKVKRKAASLGPVKPRKVLHTVPQYGQTGFHTRVDYNKWLMKIVDNPDELKIKGGYLNYGQPKNKVILLKGSVPGPRKRLICLRKSIRPNKKIPEKPPEIVYISKSSKQGN